MSLGLLLLIGLMLATLAVLVTGIAVMVSGGKLNAKYGNKLMTLRVGLQALALVVFAVLVMIKE